MFRFASSRTPMRGTQRWRRRLAGPAAALAGSALVLASQAAAKAVPAAPPPVTVLTSSPLVGKGYFFISPYGDQAAYANGPEILDPG
ncbi:MAG TPA: hypothetical protein VL996_04925, partial [Methylocella sp.]|nr:hypothetical protein [Methylocella sp.]